LWDPVTPAAETPNEWVPAPAPSAPPVSAHEPSPLFRADQADQIVEPASDVESPPRAEDPGGDTDDRDYEGTYEGTEEGTEYGTDEGTEYGTDEGYDYADADDEPDPRADRDEGSEEFGWPEFEQASTAGGSARGSARPVVGPADRPAGGVAGSGRPPDSSQPGRREGHERSHEPA
jgi:hypothetical protein